MERFDAIVVGTGQAGPALARDMAGRGMRVAILERHLVGGTCVNTGCIPTKTLVASARVAHVARRAADFGVRIAGRVAVDMKAVKARTKRVSGASNKAVTKGLESNPKIELIRGHGRFEGPRVVGVNGRLLTAPRIFLNVGGRATRPDIAGLATVPYLVNSSILELDVLPKHLVIVGGSYIGLEFGQMYRRFGSEVTILQRGPRLVPREDEDVSQAIREILEAEGVRVVTNAECLAAEKRGRNVVVRARGKKPITGSHLLLAAGRAPNTHDLGVEKAGIALDESGYIRVDDELRTTADGVWALGDCNGRGAFTHTSYNDYEIVSANLFERKKRKRGAKPRRVTDRIPAYALYIDPPLGRCGMTEREARESGRRVLAAKYFMENVGRAFERSETAGFMKVLVDAKTERILGASLLGIEADEVMHTLLDLMYADAPYTVVTKAMHVHPTVSEYLPSLFYGLEPLEPVRATRTSSRS